MHVTSDSTCALRRPERDQWPRLCSTGSGGQTPGGLQRSYVVFAALAWLPVSLRSVVTNQALAGATSVPGPVFLMAPAVAIMIAPNPSTTNTRVTIRLTSGANDNPTASRAARSR